MQRNRKSKTRPKDVLDLVEVHMYKEAVRLDKERMKRKRIYEV